MVVYHPKRKQAYSVVSILQIKRCFFSTFQVLATMREAGRGLGYGPVKSIHMPHSEKIFQMNKMQDRYKSISRGHQPMSSQQGSINMDWKKRIFKPKTVDIFADDDR